MSNQRSSKRSNLYIMIQKLSQKTQFNEKIPIISTYLQLTLMNFHNLVFLLNHILRISSHQDTSTNIFT